LCDFLIHRILCDYISLCVNTMMSFYETYIIRQRNNHLSTYSSDESESRQEATPAGENSSLDFIEAVHKWKSKMPLH